MKITKKVTFEELMKGGAFSSAFKTLTEDQQKIMKTEIEKIIEQFHNKIIQPISEIKEKT